jgi:RNA polymerase sigma-70 factor (ECF subfamily)
LKALSIQQAEAVDQNPTARLVRQCIEQDDAAKARFYNQYYELVSRAVSRKLHTLGQTTLLKSEIADICNDIFSRILVGTCPLLRKLHCPASLNAWLMVVSQNHTVDYVRKWQSVTRIPVAAVCERPADYDDGGRRAVRSERARALASRLASLSDTERIILDMFFVQGLKYMEISEITGLNINTVSAKLRRAKLKLRRLLEKEAI